LSRFICTEVLYSIGTPFAGALPLLISWTFQLKTAAKNYRC